MARDSAYSIRIPTNGTTTADRVIPSSNVLSSSYSKMSFVCWHDADSSYASMGLFGNWTGAANGNILFRHNTTAIQFYVYTGGVQYGPALAPGNYYNGTYCKGFRFDGSATGAELASFINGLKGTAAGPATMAAAATSPAFGYGGTASQAGYAGNMRDAFLWIGKALPDSAFQAIAGGVHPLVFGPTHWWPMDNTLVDLVGGVNLTLGANASHDTTATYKRQALPISAYYESVVVAAGGPTVYTVDVTDGIYFFDGEDNRDTSKTILDSMFVNSLQSRAQDMQFSDQLLTSDGLTKQLEKIVLDSLFVGDSSTVEALGTALSITVIDYLFLNDTVVKDIQKVVQESLLMSSSIVKLLELINREDILLSSQVFRGIDINRYDPLYINWVLFKTLDINTIDPLLMDDTDRLFLLRELLIRDNILINEFTLTQLYTLVTAVLVYAKISTVDFLGIGIAMNKNFLGITHSVYTGANQ